MIVERATKKHETNHPLRDVTIRLTQGGLRNTAFLCAYIQCFAKGEEQRLISFCFVSFRFAQYCQPALSHVPGCYLSVVFLPKVICMHCIYLARITYTSDCLNFNWCTQHFTLPKSPTPVLYNLDQQYNNPYLANTSLVSSWYFYLSVCH